MYFLLCFCAVPVLQLDVGTIYNEHSEYMNLEATNMLVCCTLNQKIVFRTLFLEKMAAAVRPR